MAGGVDDVADSGTASVSLSASAAGENNDPVSQGEGMDSDEEGGIDATDSDMAAYYSAGSISPCWPAASSEVAPPGADGNEDKKIMPPPPPRIRVLPSTPESPPGDSYGDRDSPSRGDAEDEDEEDEETMDTSETLADSSQSPTSSNNAADASGSVDLSGGASAEGMEHSPYCHYYMWDVTHRASLLEDQVVEDYLVASHKRRRGKKPKRYNKEAEEEQIREDVRAHMASGIVREYLNGSKEVYDQFEENQKKFCYCGVLFQMKTDGDVDNIDN